MNLAPSPLLSNCETSQDPGLALARGGGWGGYGRSFQGGALKAGGMLKASGYSLHLSDRLRGAVESLGA